MTDAIRAILTDWLIPDTGSPSAKGIDAITAEIVAATQAPVPDELVKAAARAADLLHDAVRSHVDEGWKYAAGLAVKELRAALSLPRRTEAPAIVPDGLVIAAEMVVALADDDDCSVKDLKAALAITWSTEADIRADGDAFERDRAHQRAWSLKTFGPGRRVNGVLDHIGKELIEIRAAPDDLEEWVDLLLLSFDGAMRMGFTPAEIMQGMRDKQKKNEGRDWPDWRTSDPNKAIEHVRSQGGE